MFGRSDFSSSARGFSFFCWLGRACLLLPIYICLSVVLVFFFFFSLSLPVHFWFSNLVLQNLRVLHETSDVVLAFGSLKHEVPRRWCHGKGGSYKAMDELLATVAPILGAILDPNPLTAS